MDLTIILGMGDVTENRHIKRSLAPRPRALLKRRAVSRLRFMVAVLALLALAVQSFVVQTHIHIPQVGGKAQTVSLITVAASVVHDQAPTAPRDKYPITEDPSNCPLCQELTHSGQFVQSAAAVAILPPYVNIHFIDFDEALPSFIAVSHVWHGRAPPVHSENS